MTPWETSIASSLVATMSTEELRLYSQVPTEINLEMSHPHNISIPFFREFKAFYKFSLHTKLYVCMGFYGIVRD